MTKLLKPIRYLSALGLLMISQPIWSYDLMQAYQDALLNDAQLNSSRAALEASRQQVPQARAGLRPSLSASAGVNRNWSNPNISPSTQYTSQSYGIGLNYPLYRPQNLAAFDQSKLALNISEAQFGNARQDLILRVAQAYFDVLAAKDDLTTVRSQKTAIAEQLAAAKRNFEVGTATVTDQQEAQARFDLTAAQEVASENALAVRLSALGLLTGKPVNNTANLRAGVSLSTPEPAVESIWTERAREGNFSVIQAQISTELARREIDRQRYGRYPTLDVTGNLSHNRNASSSLVGISSNNAGLGLQLSVPIYSGGAITARIREAAANLDKANADLEVARRAAEQATRVAYLGLVSGLGQVTALEAAEKSSRLALDSNRLGYQVGVRINVDVLNAQQQLFSTQRDLARARYDVLVNGLRLKASTGALEETDLRSIGALLTTVEQSSSQPAAAPAGPTTAKPQPVQLPGTR
ncbi:MAG: TolC family outer membrane protein [Burkholderiaceae bacterium]